jgi:outer membrane receptor protein involved in Fe transport
VKLYLEDGDIDWVDQFNESTGLNADDTLTDYKNYGVRVRETMEPWDGTQVLAGLDVDYISGETDVVSPPAPKSHFDEETFRIVAPYVAISHLIGSKENFYAIPSAGVRYMDHSDFDDEWGPQAGLALGYKNTELHGFYSRGVNYPGLFVKVQEELFMPGENQSEGLQAETLNHFELGISHLLTDKVKVDATYFYDDGENRIVVAPPPPFPPVFENVGNFRTRGVEGTVTIWPTPHLSLFAGFTYLEADPADLPYAPKWSASGGLNYRFLEKFLFSMDTLYVDEHFATSRGRTEGAINTEKVGSAFLLNAKLSYDFSIPSWRTDGCIYIAVENLTDTEYEFKPDYPMPGINGMIGLVLKF